MNDYGKFCTRRWCDAGPFPTETARRKHIADEHTR